MSDVTPIETPPKKKRGRPKKNGASASAEPVKKPRRGQLQVPGTERTEIPKISEINNRRIAACKDRLSAQSRESDAKKELLAALEEAIAAEQIPLVSKPGDKKRRYVYRYEDDEGVTRDVVLVVVTTEKRELKFEERDDAGDDE